MGNESDEQLLRAYAREGSQDAFAEVVRRYTGLVYAAAVRQVRDPGAAQDVAQVVFLGLARRAGSIRGDVPLSAWLLKSTRFAVLATRKAQGRRARHERKAAEMTRRMTGPSPTDREDPWDGIEPLLDEALSRLSERVRTAIVLRFFDELSFDDLAVRLGITCQSARQRVSRGVGQLREFFASRGVTVSEAGLTAAITAHATPPPPEGLWPQLAAAVKVKQSAGPLAATKGVVTLMALTKTQAAAVCAAGLLLLGGGAAVAWHSMRDGSQDVVIRPDPTTGASAPADWRELFANAYRPADGRVLRRIAPPYLPARADFWEQEQRSQGNRHPQPLMKQESLVIVWEGDTPHWQAASLDGGTLDDALWFCANLRPWDLDKSVPRTLKLPGDFSVRQGASAEQVMAELGPIVSAKLGRSVHFEKRHVSRPAIVARGSYRFVPLEANADNQVIDFAAGYPAAPAGPKARHSTLGHLLNEIKNQLETRVVDETPDAARPVSWRYDNKWVSPDNLLANVARQTSLTLTRQEWDADAWFMVSGDAAK